jgi:hypothetical protein
MLTCIKIFLQFKLTLDTFLQKWVKKKYLWLRNLNESAIEEQKILYI